MLFKALLLLAGAGVVTALTPNGLRFQSVGAQIMTTAKAGANETAGPKYPGKTDMPVSTAMKCVMCLLFLYYIVLVILKIIGFKREVDKMFDEVQAMTGMNMNPMSYAQQAMDKTKEAASKATDAAMTATGAAGEATPEAEEDKEKKAAEATDDNQASLLEQTKKTMTDPKAMAAASKDAAMASFNRGKAMVQDAFSDNRLNMILQNMSGVPMFCILIVFFRLRAKVDLETEPQQWAKTMMILATVALYVQILTCLIPTCPNEEGKVSMGAKAMQFTMMVLNISGMVCLYGGIIAIIYAIFTLPYKYDDWLEAGSQPASFYVDASGALKNPPGL